MMYRFITSGREWGASGGREHPHWGTVFPERRLQKLDLD
jgi:hypothetical protein